MAADAPSGPGGGRPLGQPDPGPGTHFRLSDAEPAAAAAGSGPPSTYGEPVEGEVLATLVARLPELPADAVDPVDVRLPSGPPRPAISGETIEVAFPPPQDPGQPPAEPDVPLAVERFQPEGDVPIGSHLAVTFSRPFAPLAANAELDARDVPVRLDPQPAGRWRWIGTRTLVFEPEARFPMASEFAVEVPAGVEAADGTPLGETTSWSFRTPPVQATEMRSWVAPTDRRALVVVTFDQAIEREAIEPFVSLAEPYADLGLEGASESIVAAFEGAEAHLATLPAERWVALVTPPGLPPGAAIDVRLMAGAPSAEGPRTTDTEAVLGKPGKIEVFDHLRADSIACDLFGSERTATIVHGRARIALCDPFSPWRIDFSNWLDESSLTPDTISVEPAVPGLRVDHDGAGIALRGFFTGRTTYTVRVAPGLRDEFGQELDEALELTFETGDAPAALVVPGSEMLILDPAGPRALTVTTLNNPSLEVMLYRVAPERWPEYVAWRTSFWRWAHEAAAEGMPMPELFLRDPDIRETIEIDGEADTFNRVLIDLRPALDGELGHVVVIVKPSRWVPDRSWRNRNQPHAVWVQSTNLGLDVAFDAARAMAFVTDLADGSPIAGARVAVQERGTESGPTGADGIVDLPPFSGVDRSFAVARRAGDSTILPGRFRTDGAQSDERRWFVFDDRGIYRPGETVAIKGYVRRVGKGVGGDVEALAADGSSVEGGPAGQSAPATWVLSGWDQNEIASGEFRIGAYGAFDFEIDLPADAPVGHVRLELNGGENGDHELDINIAEFRRPEFEVGVEAETPQVIVGERGYVGVSADYFAGGALPGAEVVWSVHAESSEWRPAGWGDFAFGRRRPWWMYWGGAERSARGEVLELAGRTDVEGRHRLAIDLTGISPPATMSLVAQATVADVNRQASSASTAVLAHPSSLYVGVRAVERVIERGELAEIEVVAVDLDGAAVSDRAIRVVAERIEHRSVDGSWTDVAEPADACEVVSAGQPVRCALRLGVGGRYRVRASLVDDAGRASDSEVSVWVPGGPVPPRDASLAEQVVEIVPDKDEYAVGDVATVLVRAPFAGAEAVVSLRRSGLVDVRRMRLEDGSDTIEIPIEEGFIPNLYLDVQLVGSEPRIAPQGTDDAAAAGASGEGAGADEAMGDDGVERADAPPRPAFARGTQELRVPPLSRTLGVEVSPSTAQLRPGAPVTVTVGVTDSDGRPLPDAQVALVVVDEAVLALTGYRIPDPIQVFYTARGPDTADHRNRGWVHLTPADVLAAVDDRIVFPVTATALAQQLQSTPPPPVPASGGVVYESVRTFAIRDADELASLTRLMSLRPPPPMTGGGGRDEPAVVAERVDLDPLAAFVPSFVTGEDGRAVATFTLPDNVTRYRITAVATDGAKRFGTGEADLAARLPLTARPSAPRFLNFGDAFELPVVVQNLSGADREVDVVVRAANLALRDAAPAADSVAGGAPLSVGARVRVPDGDRVEVRFPALATKPGTAAFQAAVFAVDDPALADAQRVTLPVYTPATTEAFATYGHVDEGSVAQPVLRPRDVVPGFGGLEVTLSSTALAELTDAFLYLESYPFECAEQLASRLIAIVSMRDVLAAFGVEGLQGESEIDAVVAAAIEKLVALQRDDGGFGWWSGGWEPSEPWVSLHATNALVRSRDKGARVDDVRLERALRYLEQIRRHIDEQPWPWSENAKRAAEAYALSVRRAAGGGQPDRALSARAVALATESDPDDTVETLGFLLQVLAGDPEPRAAEAAAELARRIGNRVTETASAATIATAYSEDDGALILSSSRRADAVVLDAWMSHAPDSDLIPKLVRGLLDGRVRGRWSTTQENSFSLIALDRYFRTYEAVEPDFSARAWVDQTFAGEARFQGRSGDRAEIDVPLDALPERDAADLLLSKAGPGRLYYRLGLRYAPEDLDLPADERGFAVLREYEAVDDPGDVRRRADGGWAIRAGARVRIKLRMDAPSRRYHVALVDPLPAGFEALNPELITTERIPGASDEATGDGWRWWWGWRWYDHEAFRDHRVEVFAGRVTAGVFRYDYVARATTPGVFVVPPAKAEEMYHPETFGRSGTDRVVIE